MIENNDILLKEIKELLKVINDEQRSIKEEIRILKAEQKKIHEDIKLSNFVLNNINIRSEIIN